MDINVQKLEKGVVAIICLGIVGFGFYLLYVLFFTVAPVETTPGLANINPGAFGPKIKKAAAALVDANQKISLKKTDLFFSESALFKSFTDVPTEIPLSDSRGREDPFVPYAAP